MNVILILLGYIAAAVTALFVRPRPAPQPERRALDRASYNMGLRDAGEILRDIRVECGIPVGENPIIEEALGRLNKCFK